MKTFITKKLIKEFLPTRPQNSNKGTFGKVLNIAGCYNYQGAAYLSSIAPLKIGAGLVTLATIESVINNIAANMPCVTFYPLRDFQKNYIASDAFSELKKIIEQYTVYSIGPGLSTEPALYSFVDDFIKYANTKENKVVIDADALNIISKLDINKLPENSIITPHPMELSRLLKISIEEIQANRMEAAKKTTKKYGCTTILKGNETVVCTKDLEIYTNTTGNSSMAKAGSGDVLTGILSGLLAQGLTTKQAALLGVYLHGLSGDIARRDLSEYSVLASDLIKYLPEAIKVIKEE